MNFNNGENVIDKLNLLLFNIPENTTLLEKIRWLYIKVGEVFSYNYKVLNDIDYAKKEIDFSKDYIGRYQTCTQISYLLNIMLNNLEGCTSKVIVRKANIRGNSDVEHVANEVTLVTGEKFILDLTLDLYLIQSGCQTKQFGFTGDIYNTCDIISLKECEIMDRKLGLIKNGEYTDRKIERQKQIIDSLNYSNIPDVNIIEHRMSLIRELLPNFNGYHEGKLFINKLFNKLLGYSYKEYNLRYIRDNGMELLTCFKIYSGGDILWYLYDPKLGIIETNIDRLVNMLSSGWTTKSKSLFDEIAKSSKHI